MSRIGKLPVEVPAGVTVELNGSVVVVQGPKGVLSRELGQGVGVELAGRHLKVLHKGSDRQSASNYGTSRALLQTMVTGVSTGWKKSLDMTGVGFGAKLAGPDLVLTCGFSHEVKLPVPAGISCTVGKTNIEVSSCDKELVGRFAATIRNTQPPEPYLGKGIRYSDEVVRRKAGKTGKK